MYCSTMRVAALTATYKNGETAKTTLRDLYKSGFTFPEGNLLFGKDFKDEIGKLAPPLHLIQHFYKCIGIFIHGYEYYN